MNDQVSRPSTVDYRNNGRRPAPLFSATEVGRRHAGIRGVMASARIDAALFTSYHCINYYSGFLYCYFGRKYGMVIDHDKATTISAGIDGGLLEGLGQDVERAQLVQLAPRDNLLFPGNGGFLRHWSPPSSW